MTGQQARILVVEDDSAVRNLIATALDVHGYAHGEVEDGRQALMELTDSQDYSILILDLGLPDMDGVDVIRTLRGWSRMPIIVVSARMEDADKVQALDAGADDYLVKPFSVEELLARVRVAQRRLSYMGSLAEDQARYSNGDLEIDYQSATVTSYGREVHLTPIEYRLLSLLARNTGRVLTYSFIMEHIWGDGSSSDIATLRVFMATLRKKIEAEPSHPRYLQTHMGIGYRMLRVEP